ncbi:MAG: response regulator [Planctomycetaceae bacterium]|nr:response regulator [Planctomycetaceae bacterium]
MKRPDDAPARSFSKSVGTSLGDQPPPRHVLIVDDTRVAAHALERLLEALGQRVRVALSGMEALRMVAEERPDVVISDISMPDLDGYELARRIRSDPGCDRVTLVALTAYGQAEDRRVALDAGFGYHLVKPVSLKALQELFAGFPTASVSAPGGTSGQD